MQNLAAVDVMDVFRDMPAISNFGAPPQGNLNNTYFMPNIHQLGASASNTTLVLIDGARVPLGGTLPRSERSRHGPRDSNSANRCFSYRGFPDFTDQTPLPEWSILSHGRVMTD